jgi:fructokinase
MKRLYGAVEGGGTKFVCAVGSGAGDIVEEVRIPTTTPSETLEQAIAFFKKHSPAAIGLASFGPLELDPASAAYGSITATPKPGWSGTNLVAAFKRSFEVPVLLELDVNAAAFGEYTLIPENRGLLYHRDWYRSGDHHPWEINPWTDPS